MFTTSQDGRFNPENHSENTEQPVLNKLKNIHLKYCDILDEAGPIVVEHQAWLDELYQLWLTDQRSLINEKLNLYFGESLNPCRTVLFFCSKSPDFFQNKCNTLALYVLKYFETWINDEENNFCIKSISLKLKTLAFNTVLKQKNLTLIENCFKVFDLQSNAEIFVENIKFLILTEKYKEAAICAKFLKLEEWFDITQIALPLIFQDKVNIAENYLENCPALQISVVKFLDNLCAKNTDYDKVIRSLDLPQVAKEKWNLRIIKKLASRLMKKYNVPADLCPNICQINNTGALKYLLYKKYIEKSMEDDNWDEMVQAAVGNDANLQRELIDCLRCYNDISCAAKYATKFNINVDFIVPQSEVNHTSFQVASGQNSVENKKRTEDWETEIDDTKKRPIDFHELGMSMDQIHLINNKTDFSNCLKLLQNSTVLGIDSEWKPTFGLQKEKVSILQIATSSSIFILDILELQNSLSDDDWKALFNSTFCNINILKLGFGIQNDIKIICRSIPCISHLNKNIINVLDLQTLVEKLVDEIPCILPYESRGKGLCGLVSQCFGKPLNKAEQFSNWERRPLRDSQMHYAALDAYCLIEIHDMLTSQAAKFDINLAAVVNSLMNKQKKHKHKKTMPSQILQDADIPSTSVATNPPDSLKVVVDTMLQGLGRKLRLCGVDVKILETNTDHEEAVKIALSEKRVILTSGAPFLKLNQYVPQGMCYNVLSESAKKQAAEVLEHFNIKVTSKSIFSRCQICNGDQYIKVPSSSMKYLWQLYNDSLQNKEQDSGLNVSFSFDGGSIDGNSFQTETGAVLYFKPINEELLNRVKMFFVCAFCGKIYWVGVHWRRTKEYLGTILVDTDE